MGEERETDGMGRGKGRNAKKAEMDGRLLKCKKNLGLGLLPGSSNWTVVTVKVKELGKRELCD
jgi:hypothetical protein